MQITETKSEGLSRELEINLSSDEISGKINDRIGEIQRTAQLPGFRPGKVPISVLKKRFGKAVLGEVLEKAIGESSQQAMTEKGIRPAIQPEIEVAEFEDGKDLQYTLAVEVLPNITLMDFSKIRVQRLVPQGEEKDVEQALENLAKAHQGSEPIKRKRKSKQGDILTIDFIGSVDGKEFPGGKADNYSLELGSNSFIPGFEDQLIGSNAGDNVDVQVMFPGSYGAAELAGKEALFKVTVNEIREATPAPIDDELAKKAGMADLVKLREAIAEEQAREYVSLARSRVKRLLLDELYEAHDFELPKKMVDSEFDTIWADYEQRKKDGKIEDEEAPKPEDIMRAELREIAGRRVQLGLLLAEVGRQNDIQIAQEDINRAIMEEARRYPGQEDKILDFYKQNPKAMENVTAPIYEEKVVDFIMELADVRDTKVPLSKFIETLEKDREDEEKEVKKSTRTKKSGSKKKQVPAKSLTKKTDKKDSNKSSETA
ncbi:MAG: trigger factor [Rhodospirillaceae bacterium TMED8]|nr:trigger factor [Magnetovibrio sp.]OUT49669.1 MAG: trigger factor [Rhodospirillaceae bacterium TMED8]